MKHLITLEITEEDGMFRARIEHDGKVRLFELPPHDGSRGKRRRALSSLFNLIPYAIRAKVFPEDTPVYEQVRTDTGIKTIQKGWPEEIAAAN